jgi:hypothetical protein
MPVDEFEGWLAYFADRADERAEALGISAGRPGVDPGLNLKMQTTLAQQQAALRRAVR